MKFRSLFAAAAFLAVAPVAADAAVITIADPMAPTELGARIRWGATGFEASLFDNRPTLNQSPTLNPTGTPVWTSHIGNPHAFKVEWDPALGQISLMVDFNRDGDFLDSQESAVRLFPEYLGHGPLYLSISGNESGSTARSQVTNLMINGTALPNLVPNGAFIESFYADMLGARFNTVTFMGDITFLNSGTAQERPSWNFNLKSIPEPGTLAVFGLGLLGLAALRRRTDPAIQASA